MADTDFRFLDLQHHCASLSVTLAELWMHDPVSVIRDDETLEYPHAAEWLDLAAGVIKVEVVTGRFDHSLMYCESAMTYEDARSDLLSLLAAQLTIFSFTWGAFETVAKIVDPPSIPSAQRMHGSNGLTDRVAYFIRSCPPLHGFAETLDQFRHLLAAHPCYSKVTLASSRPPYMGISGQGIDLVRRVRNKFAHGAASLPTPDGWGSTTSSEPQVIASGTRIVLLTTQMLLATHYQGASFDISSNLWDQDEANVLTVLQGLHLESVELGEED